jgi:uncharacterized protein
MKLHADRSDTPVVTAHGQGWVAIDGQRHEGDWVLSASGKRHPWQRLTVNPSTDDFSALSRTDDLPPELVLFGSGSRLTFPHPSALQGLMQQGIGVETMDTPAACRTYNILAAEGRRVVLALLNPSAPASD